MICFNDKSQDTVGQREQLKWQCGDKLAGVLDHTHPLLFPSTSPYVWQFCELLSPRHSSQLPCPLLAPHQRCSSLHSPKHPARGSLWLQEQQFTPQVRLFNVLGRCCDLVWPHHEVFGELRKSGVSSEFNWFCYILCFGWAFMSIGLLCIREFIFYWLGELSYCKTFGLVIRMNDDNAMNIWG